MSNQGLIQFPMLNSVIIEISTRSSGIIVIGEKKANVENKRESKIHSNFGKGNCNERGENGSSGVRQVITYNVTPLVKYTQDKYSSWVWC